jgi:hypothetical protein
VIWTEFGFGDEIMFARFAQTFKHHFEAETVSIVCQKPLLKLFKTIPSVDLVVSEEDVKGLPKHHYWVFPHSIPVYYSLEKCGIPAPIPYFNIPMRDIKEVNKFLPAKVSHRMRVGLVTRGSPTHENDKSRSIANLSELQELFQIPGIDWIDIQKELPIKDCEQIPALQHVSLVHVGGQMKDFMQTAAVCAQLDLLICVDTAVAHLAGALNVPVWLMLPFQVDWRWGIHTSESPWYPSIKIFRQENFRNWANVVEEIHLALCQKLRHMSFSLEDSRINE